MTYTEKGTEIMICDAYYCERHATHGYEGHDWCEEHYLERFPKIKARMEISNDWEIPCERCGEYFDEVYLKDGERICEWCMRHEDTL